MNEGTTVPSRTDRQSTQAGECVRSDGGRQRRDDSRDHVDCNIWRHSYFDTLFFFGQSPFLYFNFQRLRFSTKPKSFQLGLEKSAQESDTNFINSLFSRQRLSNRNGTAGIVWRVMVLNVRIWFFLSTKGNELPPALCEKEVV